MPFFFACAISSADISREALAIWMVPLMSEAIPVPDPPPVTEMRTWGLQGHVALGPGQGEVDEGVRAGVLDGDRAGGHGATAPAAAGGARRSRRHADSHERTDERQRSLS